MPGKYAQSRNCWENFNRYQFDGVGIYDIPEIKGCDILKPPDLIGFNGIAKCKDRSNKAVHFFLDDYQFMRVWTHPEEQLKRLQKFKYVLSPDFSIYTDFPKALQIYAHFKKHWVAKLWEENDIKVIPTISWGDESSYDFCFDGEPVGGTVAITSQGTQNNAIAKRLFLKGYDAMLERLQPSTIIFYGIVPNECKGNIVHINTFCEKFRIARMEMR